MNQLLCSVTVEEGNEMNIYHCQNWQLKKTKAMSSCTYVSDTKHRTLNEGQSTDVCILHLHIYREGQRELTVLLFIGCHVGVFVSELSFVFKPSTQTRK